MVVGMGIVTVPVLLMKDGKKKEEEAEGEKGGEGGYQGGICPGIRTKSSFRGMLGFG